MATLNQMGRMMTRNTRTLSKEVGLNLSDMELYTGVSRRTLGRIEQARRERRTYNPMLKTAVKLAAALGVSLDAYLTEAY